MNNGIFLSENAQMTGFGGLFTIGWLVIMIVAMYFIMIRPQKKKQREHDLLISEVKAGDSVLTTSGFYGNVIVVEDEIVVVEFGNNKNCRIPMRKDAIVEIESDEVEEKTEKKDKDEKTDKKDNKTSLKK